MILTAGKKLREQAAERTRRHIAEQSRGRTDLTRMLNSTTDNFKPGDYVAQEQARLLKIEAIA